MIRFGSPALMVDCVPLGRVRTRAGGRERVERGGRAGVRL